MQCAPLWETEKGKECERPRMVLFKRIKICEVLTAWGDKKYYAIEHFMIPDDFQRIANIFYASLKNVESFVQEAKKKKFLS